MCTHYIYLPVRTDTNTHIYPISIYFTRHVIQSINIPYLISPARTHAQYTSNHISSHFYPLPIPAVIPYLLIPPLKCIHSFIDYPPPSFLRLHFVFLYFFFLLPPFFFLLPPTLPSSFPSLPFPSWLYFTSKALPRLGGLSGLLFIRGFMVYPLPGGASEGPSLCFPLPPFNPSSLPFPRRPFFPLLSPSIFLFSSFLHASSPPTLVSFLPSLALPPPTPDFLFLCPRLIRLGVDPGVHSGVVQGVYGPSPHQGESQGHSLLLAFRGSDPSSGGLSGGPSGSMRNSIPSPGG